MIEMIEVKTADLVGAALDWAVSCATVLPNSFDMEPEEFQPSTDWAQGGPLIEKYQAYPQRYDDECEDVKNDNRFFVLTHFGVLNMGGFGDCTEGPTPLIAAMRAIVAAKLGDTVSVPAELVTSS